MPTSAQFEAGWQPLLVFSNFAIQEAIEGGFLALVSVTDPRIRNLRKAHKNFDRFLARFKDTFGRKIGVTVLIAPGDVPDNFRRTDAISGFRDLVAMSVIPYNRAAEIKHPSGHRLLWADYFNLYPWMTAKDYDEDLIGNSPALLGVDEVAKFRGQSAPEVSPRVLDALELDKPLLDCLLNRWSADFIKPEDQRTDRTLFRSLNMAFRAAALPGGLETSFYDVGRLIALWISAFEILIHPGVAGGKANLSKVYDLLSKVAWKEAESATKNHNAYNGHKPAVASTNACWLYGELYKARCDFLHGNPVQPSVLVFPQSGRRLFEFAAPLYRMALSAFLPLAPSAPPQSSAAKHIGEYTAGLIGFNQPQCKIERALLLAHVKPK